MLRLLLTAAAALFFKCNSYCQKNNPVYHEGVTLQIENDQKVTDLTGTFQFQVKSLEHKVLRNEDFEFMVESNRKETEDVYIRLDDDVVLYIPSRQKIQQPGYQRLTEYKIED